MNDPTYFVLVFGDPGENGDRVESGRYEAGEGYPAFGVKRGDMLLLYGTSGYSTYPMQFAGIGVAIEANDVSIEYRWIPFTDPIPRNSIAETFEPDDQVKMNQLRFSSRRAFQISLTSYLNTVKNQKVFPTT